MAKKRVVGRKLLVASVGVAAISYVACTTTTSGNLVAPEGDASAEEDGGSDALVTSGNLMPPPADAKADAPVTSGNLMPPPPVDGGDGGDASEDAGTD